MTIPGIQSNLAVRRVAASYEFQIPAACVGSATSVAVWNTAPERDKLQTFGRFKHYSPASRDGKCRAAFPVVPMTDSAQRSSRDLGKVTLCRMPPSSVIGHGSWGIERSKPFTHGADCVRGTSQSRQAICAGYHRRSGWFRYQLIRSKRFRFRKVDRLFRRTLFVSRNDNCPTGLAFCRAKVANMLLRAITPCSAVCRCSKPKGAGSRNWKDSKKRLPDGGFRG